MKTNLIVLMTINSCTTFQENLYNGRPVIKAKLISSILKIDDSWYKGSWTIAPKVARDTLKLNLIKKIIFIITILVFNIQEFNAQNSFNETTFKWLFESFDKEKKQNDVPSLSVAIVSTDNVIIKNYGTLSRTDTLTVNDNSFYQIASQTKTFTGIIANQLIKQGKLDINMPITHYLGKELTNDAKTRLAKISVKNLLNHTAGIPRTSVFRYAKEHKRLIQNSNGEYLSSEELLFDLNRLLLQSTPSEQFEYSNLGYAIVGIILENASNKKFSELFNEFCSQHRLTKTFIELTKINENNLVIPYDKGNRTIEKRLQDFGIQSPASGAISTIRDLSSLMQLQLNGYINHFDNIFKLTNSVTPAPNKRQKKNLEYGFGLFKHTEQEKFTYFSHGGDLDGYGCEYYFSPEKNIGLVVLTSSGGKWLGEKANELFLKLAKEK